MIGWRANLFTGENELAARKDATRPMKAAAKAAAAGYEASFADLAAALANLGDPIYTTVPARDDRQRIVFVPADHPVIAPLVAHNDIDGVPWNKGLLVPLTPDELENVGKIGHPVIMYLSVAEYMTASRLLTGAQLERDLRQRYANGGPTAVQTLQHLIALRLSLVAHLGAVIELARSAPAVNEEVAQRLESTRERELGLLALLLSGLPRANDDAESLQAALVRLRANLRLTRVFSAAAGQADLVACIDRMQTELAGIGAQLPRAGAS